MTTGNAIGFILFVLNFWDGIATYIYVGPNFAFEYNPIMRAAIKYLPDSWLLLKIILGFLLWFLIASGWEKCSGFTKSFVFVGLAIYSIVCITHVLNFLWT